MTATKTALTRRCEDPKRRFLRYFYIELCPIWEMKQKKDEFSKDPKHMAGDAVEAT